ncbi:MAG TPA: hypothetical protein PLV67_06010 [Methanofastidiosum sp.]|nr:hypothetical protein [Methanofastidiosum sp.]
MVFYKVLDAEGCSCNGGDSKWSLPTQNDDGTWTPGEWMPEIEGPLVECERGYHIATREQLVQWLNARIFVAETDGELIESTDHEKWVARKVRLVSEIAWDERTARLFACDCAEHVLHLYEKNCPNDTRPRKAIETARAYAEGKSTEEELAAAMAAAWDAAWAATRAAARAAAWAAARAAAWDAARAAARAAAWDAAWDAAMAAAWDAAWDAAMAAARDAEREWQTERLAQYLNGEV